MCNEKIINMLVSKLGTLTLTTDNGKFLADKSYGFDTLFLGARFVNRFRFGEYFYKDDYREKANKYYQDLFCLREASQVGNYLTETLALLVFAGVLELEKRGRYKIIDDDLLDFISSSFEHAYIFEYMLCYCVFKHDGLWDIYQKFCKADTLDKKQEIYLQYRDIYTQKDSRIKDHSKEWANFTPKYPMVILNYANQQNMIARTLRVKAQLVKRTDIALNVQGTRANVLLPKKNAYLDDFSDSYVLETLRPYLVIKEERPKIITYSDSFSIDVADTKLDMLDTENATTESRHKMQQSKYKQLNGGMKVRTVQGEFRNGLLQSLPHKCPVCGFAFDNFLIASHIKPYAKCEDTYDAMNPQNGLLMCPICDKLFESANYITIDYSDGRVIYDESIKDEKDFSYIKNRILSVNYIDCERKHYLKWHNEEFYRKHANYVR